MLGAISFIVFLIFSINGVGMHKIGNVYIIINCLLGVTNYFKDDRTNINSFLQFKIKNVY